MTVGKDRLPCMADRPDLGYTEAVLHESMRLASVAAGGVTHSTSCDTEIGKCGVITWIRMHDTNSKETTLYPI